ncbi:hypothetical protein ABPG72_012572 [Tetrahymena utriculariae]
MMQKLQNLSLDIILENRNGRILIFQQVLSSKYQLYQELEKQLSKDIDQQQQYFIDITEQLSEFQKIVKQILKNFQKILFSQQKLISLIRDDDQILNQSIFKEIDEFTIDEFKQQKFHQNQLKLFEDIKGADLIVDHLIDQQCNTSNFEDRLTLVIQNYIDLLIFMQESKCGSKIETVNPYYFFKNNIRIIKIDDLSLQITINEYCNKKYDLNCQLLDKIQQLIKLYDIPYISVRNLNLQLTSYFNHFDFRRCEINCYYDEDNPTKFYLDLGRIQAENIFSTLDLEQDNRIYIKLFFSSQNFLCKVINLIDSDYFQIFFRDQNNQYLSHTQYSSIFDDKVYFYLTNNSNKYQIIQTQKLIDIFMLKYMILKKYDIQDLLLNSINNILLDLFFD